MCSAVCWRSACSALLLSYDAGPASGLQTGGQEKDSNECRELPRSWLRQDQSDTGSRERIEATSRQRRVLNMSGGQVLREGGRQRDASGWEARVLGGPESRPKRFPFLACKGGLYCMHRFNVVQTSQTSDQTDLADSDLLCFLLKAKYVVSHPLPPADCWHTLHQLEAHLPRPS